MLAGEDTLFHPLLGRSRGGGVRATVSDDPFLSVHRRERLITIQAALHSVRPVTLTAEDRYALIVQSHHSGETFLYALMSKRSSCS